MVHYGSFGKENVKQTLEFSLWVLAGFSSEGV